MDDAAKFRRNAEDCRRQARSISLNEHREVLLRIAAEWDALADSVDRRMERKPGEPEGSAEDDSSS
jgi:hypothetical protein